VLRRNCGRRKRLKVWDRHRMTRLQGP